MNRHCLPVGSKPLDQADKDTLLALAPPPPPPPPPPRAGGGARSPSLKLLSVKFPQRFIL